MRGAAFVVALAMLLAGCSQDGPPSRAPPAPQVQGIVVDTTLRPLPGIEVVETGSGARTSTDENGFYVLAVPRLSEVVLVWQGEGFVAQSRGFGGVAGVAWANVTLERVPITDPFVVVRSFEGFLRCAAVGTFVEDPSRPHEHEGVRCHALLNDTANTWVLDVGAQAEGLVIEVAWEAQSPLASALVVRVVAPDGDVFGFQEGQSMLHLQVSAVKLAQALEAGPLALTIALEAGAGTGNHEHGAVGVFVNQRFTVFASEFHNGPAPIGYSVANA